MLISPGWDSLKIGINRGHRLKYLVKSQFKDKNYRNAKIAIIATIVTTIRKKQIDMWKVVIKKLNHTKTNLIARSTKNYKLLLLNFRFKIFNHSSQKGPSIRNNHIEIIKIFNKN